MFRALIRDSLELRLLETQQAEVVFALVDRDRQYLRTWLPWVDATISSANTLYFIRSAQSQYADGDGFHAGIWWQDRFAGVIGCQKVDWRNRKVEFGYWLGEEFQGKGIMTDCCRAVVTHAFHGWKLNRVQIQCATGNTRSAAIPRRLGFTLEGTVRQGQCLHEKFLDLYLFSMLAADWKG